MYENIPEELKQYPCWVCSNLPNREPRTPGTLAIAHVSDHTTWGTYNDALNSNTDFIGFVVSSYSPYSIIDLDNKEYNPATEDDIKRFEKIIETFDSYTEISQSGRGVHIVIKGKAERNAQRDKVEVFSTGKYFIFTGNVLHPMPICDRQELLQRLVDEMRPAEKETYAVFDTEEISDGKIIEIASRTSGESFDRLCNGQYLPNEYSSQSEADFALLGYLSFYSKSDEQVKRIFRASALGKRSKASKDDVYLNRSLRKLRASQLAQSQAEAGEVIDVENEQDITPFELTLPPGLMGELAAWFYSTAIRPVPELAIVGAFGLMSGLCGRAWNISETGLNNYIVLLGQTGIGKESIATGIEQLFSHLRKNIPGVDAFLGPSLASGQALLRHLGTKPCFISILGEFGKFFKELTSPQANMATTMLYKVLLDLYAKSGFNRILHPTAYADVSKNLPAVQAPAFSFIGEGTPKTFYESLDLEQIEDGLLSRFSIIEYRGDRVPRNLNAGCPPPPTLIQRVSDLVVAALTSEQKVVHTDIQISPEALDILNSFDKYCDAQINASGEQEISRMLWNRAHLKALKLSGLIAVGCNIYTPVVTQECVDWAIPFVVHDIERMVWRFKQHVVGTGDATVLSDLKDIINKYFHLSHHTLKRSGVPEKLIENRYVPYSYISKRTLNLGSFKRNKLGSTFALKNALQTLIYSGYLIEVSKFDLVSKFNYSGTAYIVLRGEHDQN